MGIETSVKCDVCKVEKQQTNHWYRVAIDRGTFRTATLKTEHKPWVGEKIVCGPAHAQTLFDRYLTTGTLEMQMHPEKAEQPKDEMPNVQ